MDPLEGALPDAMESPTNEPRMVHYKNLRRLDLDAVCTFDLKIAQDLGLWTNWQFYDNSV